MLLRKKKTNTLDSRPSSTLTWDMQHLKHRKSRAAKENTILKEATTRGPKNLNIE